MSDVQTLPAALREKHRYLIVELVGGDGPRFGAFVDAFWDDALALLGERGMAAADPWPVQDLWDADAGRAVIRVRKEMVEPVRAALATMQEVDGERVAVRVVAVTGTMKSARRKYLTDA